MKDITNSTQLPIISALNSKKNEKSGEPNHNESVSKSTKSGFNLGLIDDDKVNENAGNVEYSKRLVNALKVCINENETLKKEVIDLKEENKLLKDEISEQQDCILELANHYDVLTYIAFILVL